MRLSSSALRAAAIALASSLASPADAADVVKAANTNALNLGTSWVGGTGPGVNDVAVWNSTVTGANTSVLGGNVSWQGIKILNPGGAIVVGAAATNTLTLGTAGIDMSSATQNLSIISNLAIGGAQTWTVAAGRTLQIQNINTNARMTGSGNLTLARSGTGTASFTFNPGSSGSTGFGDQNGFYAYTGNWTIGDGVFVRTLRNGRNAWGAGTITLAGGTVAQHQNFSGTWNNDIILQAGTTSTIDDANGSGSRTLKLLSQVSGSGNLTIAETGAANHAKNGGVVLTATNTLSGTVAINSGAVLRVGGVFAAESTDLSAGTGGTLGTASVTINAGGALTLSRSNSWEFANAITGAGTLYVGGGAGALVTGAGTQVVTLTGSNTFSGGTELVQGTVKVADIAKLGSGYVAIKTGGVLEYTGSGSQSTTRNLFLDSGAATVSVSDPSGSLTLNPAGGTLGATGASFTKAGAGTLQFGGALGASTNQSLTVAAGRLRLTAANTFTGAVTLSGGVLELSGSGSLGSGTYAGAIANAGALEFTGSATQTLSGAITGVGSLARSGTGSLTLSNTSNAYTGGTTVTNGTLALGAAGVLADAGAVTVSGGTFDLGGFAETVGSATLSGGTIQNGTLTSAADFSVSGGTVAANAVLSGSVGLTKTGAGSATVNGAQAYTGATSVSNGTLVLGAGATLASSSIVIGDGATLETADGLTLGAGRTLSLGSGTSVVTANKTGNLTFGGGILAIDFGAATNDLLAVTGDVTITNGSVAFTKAGSYVSGIYDVLTYGGALTGDPLTLTLSGLSSDGTSRQTFDLIHDQVAKKLQLDVGGQAENVRWSGLADGIWAAGGAATAGNWTVTDVGYTGDQPNRFLNGDSVVFDDTASTGTVQIDLADVTPGSVTVSAETTDFTIGGIGVIASGALSKSGAATLTLTGANTYAGGTALSAGRIRLGVSNALGSGTVAISGGALSSDDTTARTLSNAIDLNGNVTLGDATDTGELTLSGAVDLGAASRTLTTASDAVLSGVVANGGLVKSGSGKLTLSAANTYVGGTTVSQGTLELGAGNVLANAGAVTVSGGTLAIGSNSDIIGALTLTSGSLTGTGTLTVASAAFGNSDAQTVAAVIAGSGTLAKSGNGALTLSGANTYSGATTISAGTLELGNASALGSTVAGTTVSSGATLDLKGLALGAEALTLGGTLANSSGTAASHSGTVALASGAAIGGAGDITLSNVVSGSGLGFTKVGNGALLLTAANTLSGAVAVDAGTLRLTGSGSLASSSGVSVASGAILDWARSGNFAPALSGSGTVRRSTTSGNAVFNGPNTGFSGTWEVNFLDAYIGFVGDDAVGGPDADISLSNGGGFYFTATGNTLADTRTVTLGSGGGKLNGSTSNTNTFAARFTGSGGLTKVSGELAILTNPDNDFTGALAVNTGTVEIGGAGRLGSGAYAGAISVGATLRFSTSADQLLSGLVSGGGSLQKQGSGTLTLSADNTFSGNVAVSGGVLRVSGKLFAGTFNNSSSITVSNGATLELASFAYDAVGSTGQLSDYAQRRVLSGGGIAVTGNTHSSGNNFSVANGSTGFFNVSAANQTLTLSGNGFTDILLGGALTVGGLGNLVVNEVIANNTGAGSLIMSGSGSLTLGAANTFGGGVTVQSGTVVLGNLAGFGTGNVTLAGGTLDLGGLAPTNVILISGGSLANASAWLAANTPTLSGDVDASVINSLPTTELKVAAGANVNLNGVTKDIVFEGGSLSNLSGYQGKLKVKGTLDLSSEDPLGDIEIAAGGTVDFGSRASSKTVKFTGGSVAGANFTGTVEVVGTGITLGSGIQAGTVRVTAGNSAAIAAGFGRDIAFAGGSLSGLANYSGTVSLETGATLSVGDTTTADFTLASGSTLKGSGSVGTITQASGSVLAPGNSPGLLTTDTLILGGGASMEVEFFAATGTRGTDYDAVTVTGELDLSGLSTGSRYTLNLVSLAALPSTQGALAGFDAETAYIYELFNYTALTLPASYSGSITDLFAIDKSLFRDADGNAVAGSFTLLDNAATDTLELHYAPIPEPSTYGLILGALALAGAAVRRRRAKRA